MQDGNVVGMQGAQFRPAARVLLIDDKDRVLLIRVTLPHRPEVRLWITPGGGIGSGETPRSAASRELYEETGMRAVNLGPCVWKRRHIWRWKEKWIDSEEWFYLLRTPTFEASPAAPDEWETEYMHEQRWWSVAELVDGADTETFVPRNLSELLPPILAGGIPAQPIEIGA